MKLTNTPVTAHTFGDIPFSLKRDDLLHHQFSGNKARKLSAWLELEQPEITTLMSKGGVQSNSLYSMAALAKLKGWQLKFYVERIPSWLKNHPMGNYRGALELGAQIIETTDYNKVLEEHFREPHQTQNHTLIIPEGGHCEKAMSGIQRLAQEIIDWASQNAIQPVVVALPSGTGTTALYLHKFLKPAAIEVLTCPCVGGKQYLIEQFTALEESDFPHILELENKHHFAKLYEEDFRTWQQLCTDTGVEFDLLYDPMMWRCLSLWYPKNTDKHLLYVHQGGLLGNESMLPRYQRKFSSI